MSNSMIKKSLLALVVFFGLVGNASAQWTVIDPANLIENIISAIQSIEQGIQTVQQTEQQIAMVKKMKDDIKGLNVQALIQIADPEEARTLSRLEGAISDFKRTQNALGSLQQRMDVKLRAASAVGMTSRQFLQLQIDEARAGNKAADAIIQRDMQTMSGAQSVIKQAQSWRDQIGGLNTNLGGSMQLMNTQLNQVAATNAEMLTYMAQASTDRQTAQATQQQKDAAEAQLRQDELQPAADARDKAAAAMRTGFDHPITGMFQPNK